MTIAISSITERFRFPFILLVAFIGLAVTGCVGMHSTIHVSADGSGTITEHVAMSPMGAEMMASMMEGFSDGESSGDAPSGIFEEEKLRAEAAHHPGLTLESITVSGEYGERFERTYRFEDINTVSFAMDPNADLPDDSGMSMDGVAPFQDVDFEFTPGSPARLTLVLPGPEEEAFNETLDDGGEDAMEMLQMMAEGVKYALDVEVAGTIVDTNARYLDGRRITLMEMDLGRLVQHDMKEVEALLAAYPRAAREGDESVLRELEDMGVKLETGTRIDILFQ